MAYLIVRTILNEVDDYYKRKYLYKYIYNFKFDNDVSY